MVWPNPLSLKTGACTLDVLSLACHLALESQMLWSSLCHLLRIARKGACGVSKAHVLNPAEQKLPQV
jgi:hypothetical protein